MSRKPSLLRMLLFVSLVFLQSCDNSSTTVQTPIIEPNQTPAVANTTVDYPNQRPTARETETPASTATATLKPSSTPPLTPSPPPILTLEAGDVKMMVLDYMGDNGGCRLPCIWGYTPGVSSPEDVRAFILKHGEYHDPTINIFTSYREQSGGAFFRFFEDNLFLAVEFSAYFDVKVRRLTLISGSVYDNGDVHEAQFGQPIFYRYMEYYTMSPISIPSPISLAEQAD